MYKHEAICSSDGLPTYGKQPMGGIVIGVEQGKKWTGYALGKNHDRSDGATFAPDTLLELRIGMPTGKQWRPNREP